MIGFRGGDCLFHNSPSHTTFFTFFRHHPSTTIPSLPRAYTFTRHLSLHRTHSPCCYDEMSTAVLPPARRPRPTHSQSPRRLKSTTGSSSSYSTAERVPEFQKCAKLPRKLPKLANPAREVDYSIIEQHAPDICKSGTPLSYVRDALAIRSPLCVSICFMVRRSGHMRHAMLTHGKHPTI